MPFDVTAALMQAEKNKQKKRYVLLLFNTKRAQDTDLRTIERAVGMALATHTLIRLEDPDEALKLLIIKNVELIIMDHSFLPDEQIAIDYAIEAKKRKKCPIFFISKSEDKLITAYREQMFLYEELDDYLLAPIDALEMARRLKRIDNTKARSAKRFSADAQVKCMRLDHSTPYSGSLTDLSLVGFALSLNENLVFRRHEQIQISIYLPAFFMFHQHYGDYLKLSGKVRRVSIDGRKIGCSIEYITPMQQECLTQILEKLAKRNRRQRLEATAAKAADKEAS